MVMINWKQDVMSSILVRNHKSDKKIDDREAELRLVKNSIRTPLSPITIITPVYITNKHSVIRLNVSKKMTGRLILAKARTFFCFTCQYRRCSK